MIYYIKIVDSYIHNKSKKAMKVRLLEITHIVGGWSDSSTNGWKVGLGGGGAITVCPNLDFWGIYGTYTFK